MTDVAGVDIGGTKIAVATVDGSGSITATAQAPTPTQGSRAILDRVATLIGELGAQVAAVGVGSAGVIDPRTGVVTSATDSIPGWAGTELRDQLCLRLNLPVAVDNDVHAHALGEYRQGQLKDADCALMVTVGTGIGASLLLQGQVHRGSHATAGHLGHLPTPAATGRRCPCGSRGHLEAVASGPAMMASYHDRGGAAASDLAEVTARADAGDNLAHAVIVEAATALGTMLGGLANLLDPDRLVIAGGVASCGDRWWDALRDSANKELLPALADTTRIRSSSLGGDGALLGAAYLARQELR